jgi:hypothetical protein
MLGVVRTVLAYCLVFQKPHRKWNKKNSAQREAYQLYTREALMEQYHRSFLIHKLHNSTAVANTQTSNDKVRLIANVNNLLRTAGAWRHDMVIDFNGDQEQIYQGIS